MVKSALGSVETSAVMVAGKETDVGIPGRGEFGWPGYVFTVILKLVNSVEGGVK